MIELSNYYDVVLKNNNEKIKYLLRAIDDHNDNVAKILLGIHYYTKNQYDKMFKYFDMAKLDNNTDTNESNIFLYLGKYYYKTKDYDKMIINYNKAINKNNSMALYDMACYYQQIKKYDEMKNYLLQAISYNNPVAMHGLAIYYKLIKNYNKMNEYFIMSIKFNNLLSMPALQLLYNNIKIYILLDTITNNIFIDEQKTKLLIDPKVKYYLQHKQNSKECYICYELNIHVKLQCNHDICYDCFYKIHKCPLNCSKFI
jgi:tetratricopeptide (TPR) repeat protein